MKDREPADSQRRDHHLLPRGVSLKAIAAGLFVLSVIVTLVINYFGTELLDALTGKGDNGSTTPSQQTRAPSLTTSIGRLLRDRAAAGWTPIQNREADFHGTGQRSRVFVFRHKGFSTPYDDVRVYDENEGRLVQRFRFDPIVTSEYKGASYKTPTQFGLIGIRPYFGGGKDVVIANLNLEFADSLPHIPIVIYWDSARGRYQVAPLMQDPPRIPRVANPGRWRHKGVVASAHQRFRVEYDGGRVGFTAYQATATAIVRGQSGPIVVAGYVVSAQFAYKPRLMSLDAWLVSFQVGNPGTIVCPTARPVLVNLTHVRGPLDELIGSVWRRRVGVFC